MPKRSIKRRRSILANIMHDTKKRLCNICGLCCLPAPALALWLLIYKEGKSLLWLINLSAKMFSGFNLKSTTVVSTRMYRRVEDEKDGKGVKSFHKAASSQDWCGCNAHRFVCRHQHVCLMCVNCERTEQQGCWFCVTAWINRQEYTREFHSSQWCFSFAENYIS